MGAGCPDRDVSYVSTDGAGDRPRKTKAMVCTPGFISGEWGELAYKWQETGDNSTFRDQKKTRMRFSTCSVTVAASYLKANMARSHGICVHQTRGVDNVGEGPITYVVYLPKVLQEVRCSVPGCPAVAYGAGRLREYFMHCHFRSKVPVFQEGKELLPRCDLCEIHMLAGRLILENVLHLLFS